MKKNDNYLAYVHRLRKMSNEENVTGFQDIQNNGLLDEVVPGDDQGTFWQKLRKYRGMLLGFAAIIAVGIIYWLIGSAGQ